MYRLNIYKNELKSIFFSRFAFANETSGVTEGFGPGDSVNVTGISEIKGKVTYFSKSKKNFFFFIKYYSTPVSFVLTKKK